MTLYHWTLSRRLCRNCSPESVIEIPSHGICRQLREVNTIFFIPCFPSTSKILSWEIYDIHSYDFHSIGKDCIYLAHFINTFGFLVKKLRSKEQVTYGRPIVNDVKGAGKSPPDFGLCSLRDPTLPFFFFFCIVKSPKVKKFWYSRLLRHSFQKKLLSYLVI
jgi:hypothetical protein